MGAYTTTFNIRNLSADHLHSISFDPRDGVGSQVITNSPFNYTYATLDTFYPTFQVPGFVGKVETVIIADTGQIVNVTLYNSADSLSHSIYNNIYLDQPIYSANNVLTSCRVRIYSDGVSVGTDSNVIETYTMTATESGGKVLTYKTVKA